MDKIKDRIEYGSTVIEYDMEFVNRKSLGIWVHPDGSISVKVPTSATLEQVRQKIHKKAGWIIQQKHFFESFDIQMKERRYISGESHLYLGRQYMLRVIESDRNAVHYQNNILEIECRHKRDAGIILQTWYRQRASTKFLEYAAPIIERFSIYNVKPQNIHIRNMEKRWGYCTINCDIYLNPGLIRAPRGCIEYVITHEMCHLVHRNHTKEFYALLTKEMPHWEKWKNKLERIMCAF
ncbi:MAG: SprT family zinc-dependent metalloprotease [Prevotellaceae bacterium]|nr:SprT family zinc-dependent metalloprotease [Prevotellaceae bacterium]